MAGKYRFLVKKNWGWFRGGADVGGGWRAFRKGPAGGIPVPPGPAIIFNAPLTNSLIPPVAVGPTPTFNRADTDATVIDFEGLVKNVTANEARFVGARRVENLVSFSEDFSNTAWFTFLATKVGQTTVDGVSAMEVSFDAGEPAAAIAQSNILPAVVTGKRYAIRAKVRAVGASAVIRLAVGADGTFDFSPDITITNTWTEISFTNTVDVINRNNGGVRNGSAGAATSIYIANIQFEEVTGQAITVSSEYVSTDASADHGANQDGVKYFATENDNSVVSNVLTEATGSDIPAATLEGVLVEDARTNLIQDSEDFGSPWWLPVNAPSFVLTATGIDGRVGGITATDPGAGFNYYSTPNITTPANTDPYVFSIYVGKTSGASSFPGLSLRWLNGGLNVYQVTVDTDNGVIIDRSLGGYTGTAEIRDELPNWYRVVLVVPNDGTGTTLRGEVFPAVCGTPASAVWDAAQAGSVTVDGMQIEGAFAASTYIPTAGAVGTRNAESLSYPNTNILDAEGTLALSFTPAGSTAQYTGNGDRALVGVRGANEDLLYLDSVSGEMAVADGTGTTTVTAMPALVAGTAVKLAARWSATTSLMDIGQDTTEDQAAFDGSMNKSTAMRLGFSGGNRANGKIKSILVYNGAVDDATFTGLTT